MIDALDIAAMPVADKVQRHVMASYYASQLDALQAEAKRLGHFFARADTAATMPPVLADRLAWATEYRRMVYQNPNVPEKWVAWISGSMSDGYPQEHLRSMLAALAALGIRLQASPQACALLAAEECRQREQAGLPPEPRPLLGVEGSGFDYGLFDKIDEPEEGHPA